MTRSFARRCAASLFAAFVASALVVLVELPWSNWRGAPLALALALPLALPLGTLVEVLAALFERLASASSRPWDRVLLVASVSAFVFGIGGYVANVAFVDGPVSGYTLVGYGATAVVTLSVAALVLRTTRTAARDTVLRAIACAFVALGAACAITDASFEPRAYLKPHLALAVGAAFFFAAAARIAWRDVVAGGPRRVAVVGGTVSAVAVGCFGVLLFPEARDRLSDRLIRQPTVHARLVQLARRLTDRDGDGYSAHFGGSDCDDRDPTAYPLSREGRDCYGWVGAKVADIDVCDGTRHPPRPDARPAPEIVLLVTIDAFRCGFDVRDRIELRSVCPELTAFAHRASMRHELRASTPATRESLRSLTTVASASGEGALLAGELRRRGYATVAVSTHAYQAAIAEGFDEVDTSFMAEARRDLAVTSEKITDAAIDRLRAATLAGGARFFLWVHYFDPHAPYVHTPGSHVRLSEIQAYANEVRRTDAAVARLLGAVERLGRDALMVVTADHGEEFGRHGSSHHGLTLYEAGIRVPLIVHRAGGGHEPRRFERDELPTDSEEFAPFLLHAIDDAPFRSSGISRSRTHNSEDELVSIVVGEKKLIVHKTLDFLEYYDLAIDPEELSEASAANPAQVEALGRLLAQQFSKSPLWTAGR
jgi:hypothetical protein